MTWRVRWTLAGLIAVGGPQLAAAQMPPDTVGTTTPPSVTNPPAQLQLTPAQKTAILDAIHQKGANITSPKEFRAAAGEAVPPQIELYPLPDGVMQAMPETKLLRYTMVQNQVVLVDPTTMRVIDTIPK
jgi:hypothetical protein